MSLLDRLRPERATTAPRPGDPLGWVGAVLTGVWSAGLSLLALALPMLLVWAASAQTTATWGQAVRVATDGWLVLHGVGLQVPGGSLGFVPLGLLALPGAACWFAGRRAGAGLRPDAGSSALVRALAVPVGAMSAGYAAMVVLAALVARGDGVRPVVWQAVVGGLAMPLVVGSAAAVRSVGRPLASTLAGVLRLPPRLRRTARPAALAVFSLLAAGALALTASLLVHHDRVLTLHRALDPGVVGGAVLTLAEIGVLPNLAVWGVSWLAGPGFAVGVGTAVDPTSSTLGLLPLVPVLGAVPQPGPMPAVLSAVVALPVLVGAVTGWLTARRRPGVDLLDVLADALTAAALATGALGVLLAASGGSVGPGLLAAVGPSPWKVALVLAGELAAGAGAAAFLTHRRLAR